MQAVVTVEMPNADAPADELPELPEPPGGSVSWPRRIQKCHREETERESCSSDDEFEGGPDQGSDADDEADAAPACTPPTTALNRVRCIVKGVHGGSDREVWIDV